MQDWRRTAWRRGPEEEGGVEDDSEVSGFGDRLDITSSLTKIENTGKGAGAWGG